ncbi:hypothetical protein H2200_012103 [Cladophialophora chaetospira]|uniref:Benzoate 4-monooxygenase cytochrome P450 n=1 Tax=Cladophialophora chaetospira TaxID=386627 RepID=A0AA38WY68_9EURO|nr:hypothetical protein H2200_012103 [Cladophialophora chaetospira]
MPPPVPYVSMYVLAERLNVKSISRKRSAVVIATSRLPEYHSNLMLICFRAADKMIAYLPLIITLLIPVYLYQTWRSRGLNKFPGPFFASLTDLWKVLYARNNSVKENSVYIDVHEKYGDVVRIGPNELSFADPQAIFDIYGTKGSDQKSQMYDVTSIPTQGRRTKVLLSTTDSEWHDQQRRLIAPAFNLTNILKYEPWVTDSVRVFLQEMSNRYAGKAGKEGIVDLHRWFAFFTADVISNLTYGQRTGFMESGTDISNIHAGVRLVFIPWLYLSRMPILDTLTFKNPILMFLQRKGLVPGFSSPLQPIIAKHFSERKAVWQASNQKGSQAGEHETLVDRFLIAERDNPEKFDMAPENHARTMIVAGSETTAITLTATLYFLIKHPECYKKLQAEIDAVPSENLVSTPDGEVFSWTTAQSLPYLDACIRESMRCHVVQRMPHQRVVPPGGLTICGVFVPGGTDVGIYAPVLHRRKEVFGADVEVYRPERWLEDEEKTKRMKQAMFTFSFGKYNCLGKNISRMEMYKFIPTILRRFKFTLDDPKATWTVMNGAFAIPEGVHVQSMASHLAIRVLTAQQLRHDEVLLPACVLINKSYNERESEGLLDRYPSPEDFLADLGSDGLCAIIQDGQNERLPVAIAATKRWKGRRKDQDANSNDEGIRDWEIGPAASRSSPQYRGRGLIEQCLQALSARLLIEVRDKPVRLWVKVVEEMYAKYWARKGFEQYGSSYVIPVGEWHRDRAYTLVDMVKEISRTEVAAKTSISHA